MAAPDANYCIHFHTYVDNTKWRLEPLVGKEECALLL